MLLAPVLPVASFTVACSVTVPFGVEVVIHGSDTGPRLGVTWLATSRPLAKSWNVFDDPLCPSTQSTAHAVPRTVTAFLGCVMATFSPPVAGGGGGGGGDVDGGVLETVTERDVVAEPPSVSVTLSASVCVPLAIPVVFHA